MRQYLEQLVSQWESDSSLLESDQLFRRSQVLDRLDAYFPEAAEAGDPINACLSLRACAIRTRLDAANAMLFGSIRAVIRQGICPAEFLRAIRPSGIPSGESDLPRGNGYDYLDELVSGVLQLDEPTRDPLPAGPENVFYQPTPARHVFALIASGIVSSRDVFVDLGSGLGHVPMLVSICTGARCLGIELETSLAACAARCASGLNLSRTGFIAGDAQHADLSAGTVFYLYTPFLGAVLHAVLDSMRSQAEIRPIRICTFGPCTEEVARQPWLEPITSPEPDRIAIFESRT